MNELRLEFLFELVFSFIVIYSIGGLALGKSGLWVVGHAAFLGSAGVYAWAVQSWGLALGSLITFLVCILWVASLSLSAALLPGDKFVIVSIAANYAVYMIFIGRFGEGVRYLPGASSSGGRIALALFVFLTSVLLALYGVGLTKSRMNSYLLIARDQPWVLRASRFSVASQTFWIHFLSGIPVCIAGVTSALFFRAYSPNMHGVATSLLFFIVGIPFGIDTLRGSVVAALFLVSLDRLVDLFFSSSLADRIYQMIYVFGGNSVGTASNLSAPFSEALLATFMILLIRTRPQGLFGFQTKWIRN